MTANASTREPWRVVEHSWAERSIFSGDQQICTASIIHEATEENQSGLETRETEKFALIAAAPTMYTTLAELLPGLILDLRYADDDDDKVALASRVDSVQAALSKANGN